MSGALTARIGIIQPSAGWTITEGNLGGITFGYSNGLYGSISGVTTFGGANIIMIARFTTPSTSFAVRMSGTRASNFWTTLVIDGYGTINSSSMTHSYVGSDTDWTQAINVSGIDGSGTTTGRFT